MPLLAIGLSLSLAACGRDPQTPRETLGHKDPQVRKEPKASKVSQVFRGLPVLKTQGPQGTPGEEKGEAAAVNVRAVQADGSESCETSETVFCSKRGAPDGAKCGTSPTVGLFLKKPGGHTLLL